MARTAALMSSRADSGAQISIFTIPAAFRACRQARMRSFAVLDVDLGMFHVTRNMNA